MGLFALQGRAWASCSGGYNCQCINSGVCQTGCSLPRESCDDFGEAYCRVPPCVCGVESNNCSWDGTRGPTPTPPPDDDGDGSGCAAAAAPACAASCPSGQECKPNENKTACDCRAISNGIPDLIPLFRVLEDTNKDNNGDRTLYTTAGSFCTGYSGSQAQMPSFNLSVWGTNCSGGGWSKNFTHHTTCTGSYGAVTQFQVSDACSSNWESKQRNYDLDSIRNLGYDVVRVYCEGGGECECENAWWNGYSWMRCNHTPNINSGDWYPVDTVVVRKTTPDPTPPTCTIKVNDGKTASVESGTSVTVKLNGNANTNGDKTVRAIVVRPNNTGEQVIGSCTSSNGSPCPEKTIPWTPSGDGLWYLHCDVPDVAAKCSGNARCDNITSEDPQCTSAVGCTTVPCSGWQACHAEADNASVSVGAPPL